MSLSNFGICKSTWSRCPEDQQDTSTTVRASSRYDRVTCSLEHYNVGFKYILVMSVVIESNIKREFGVLSLVVARYIVLGCKICSVNTF
jgi:hypothetical protein